MSLILLILQIISAIPTIFKIIKEIMDLIHQLNGPEKKAAEAQMRGILKKHLKEKDCDSCHAELKAFKENLKGKYGI